jgi:membrane protease YdiL (CAAX protease family)
LITEWNKPVPPTLDRKRIIVFLLFAFGIAWTTALIILLNGGLQNGQELIKGTGLTQAFFLVAGPYMFAPALANVFTRLITHEGWKDTNLRPVFKKGWKYWLAAWWLPPLFAIIGALVFFAVSPGTFDPSLSTMAQMMPSNVTLPFPLMTLFVIQMIQGILISPFINSLFTFGEEFGWRGYLLQKLLPLGKLKAVLILGVIWGIWHAPVIAMGHNYGLSYPGAPWLGILAMIWFCITVGTLISWVTIKGGSVWPAVIGHAALNGTAGFGVFLVKGNPSTLIGPMPTGILGGIAFSVFALLIWYSFRKNQPTINTPVSPPSEL